jgi:hypothetical protein
LIEEAEMRGFPGLTLLPLLLAACGDRPPDPRGVGHDEVLLQVTATGRADARPDEARFMVGVESLAPTAAAATAANNATIARVLAALRQHNVRDEHVQTRSVQLGRIDYGRDRGRFRANNVFEVKVPEIGRAGAAIAAATEAGANLLSGPQLVISDPEAASRSAYAQAYRAARARAEAYAEAAGLRVERVLAIRDAGESGRGMSYDMDSAGMTLERAAAAPAAPPAPEIRPGVTTNQVQVRADFALAE